MFKSAFCTASRIFVGLGVIATVQIGYLAPGYSQYQGNEGDIVVIGDDPNEWARFRGYWLELLQLSAPPPAETEENQTAAGSSNSEDPAAIEAALVKNLSVSELQFKPIIKLNGSSQVTGTLTNKNQTPVTVSSIAFEIVDSKGKLIQTGSAVPEPSNLAAGQSVTFSANLLGLPADDSYTVRLTSYPFVLQGGV